MQICEGTIINKFDNSDFYELDSFKFPIPWKTSCILKLGDVFCPVRTDYMECIYWKPRVIMLPSLLSLLVAPEVVITTTSGDTSDNNLGIMTIFGFQCTFNFLKSLNHNEAAINMDGPIVWYSSGAVDWIPGHKLLPFYTDRCPHRDDVRTWKCFHSTGPLWGESIGHWWIPLTKGQMPLPGWC